jgi:hypothetical protein
MIDKKIIMGILIGLSLGITPLAFSYYGTKATDLTAEELGDVIKDAISACTIYKESVSAVRKRTKYDINCNRR